MSKLRVNEIEPFSSTGVSIGGPPTGNPSSILDVQSTTQGFLPPRMNTSQRNAIASPAEGLLIYNTDSLILETYDGSKWTNATDALTAPRHVVRVTKNSPPSPGDFGSIADAVASISSPDPADPWVVWVAPGVYTERQIDVPSGVHVVGANLESVIVQPDSSTHHVFTLTASASPNNPGSSLSFLTIQNSGVGTAAVYCNDSGDFLLLHKISIINCDIGLWFRSNSRDCFSYVEYVDTTGGSIGIKVESNNDFMSYVNAENFYVYAADPSDVNPVNGAFVTGTKAQFICHAAGFEGSNQTGSAIRANNGALVDAKALSFRYWGTGLFAENVGAGCDINITGANYLHNIQDFNIANPATFGAISAAATDEGSFFSAGTIGHLSILLLDATDGDIVTSGNFKTRQPDNTFIDTTTISVNSSPMGILVSGDINPPSSPTSLTVTVEAGLGYLQKSDGSLKKITWPDTPITLPASTTSYIYFDSTSTLLSSSVKPNVTENILIGRVVTHATGIEIIEESGFQATHMADMLSTALRDGIGVAYSSGSIVSEVGTRNLNITSGSYYLGELNFLLNGANPATWVSFYQNGSGGFTRVPSQTVVDNAFWDNGTGTLTPIGSGNYAKHAIYALGDSTHDFDSEAYFMVYSQSQYTALTLAEQGALPNPPNFLSDAVTIIASVIVQQGTTNIVEIRDERPIIGSGRVSNVAASTFHHNLLGLNDFDDHQRYLPVDGSRPMTGDLPMGGHNINNANTVNAQVVNVADIPLGDSSTKAPNTKFVDETAIIMSLIFG